ncbi:MAG: phosphoglucosamine mutase [Methanomethylophilus sp.]
MARMFGTNGVRGVVNQDMTAALVLQMGKAIGTVFPGRIAVATDTRTSADMLRTALESGLMAVGCTVIELGVLPTPALQFFIKEHGGVAGGVMITASHNPPEFNGIKLIAADGTEASRSQEEKIEEAYSNPIPSVDWEKAGTVFKLGDTGEAYVDAVADKVDVAAIRAGGLTVVLDCANGAACRTAPRLLSRLGVRAITLNSNPQGEFPGHPSLLSEENIQQLKDTVRDTAAALGVAFDADADRCLFVDGRGRFVSGDKSLALLARAAVLNALGGIVVTPVATSSLVDEVVRSVGGNMIFTAVGAPIVARVMLANNAVFGGEENGGVIFPQHQCCRDAAMALAKMLELLVRNGPLAEQVDALPNYYTEKRRIECPEEYREQVVKYLADRTANLKKDTTDGLKLLFDDGWVLIRSSGTEPVFRVFAESKNRQTAENYANVYERMIKGYLSAANGTVDD